MSTPPGQHVARSRDGIVHIVAKRLPMARVACLCGAVIQFPRTTRLSGLGCVICEDLWRGQEA